MKRTARGFTLIELLIVVAIIGILAAIAIPNLITAIQRAKQKRTMVDIRAMAVAWESRATDLTGYASAGAVWTFPPVIVSGPAITALLSPTYTKTIALEDGWGTPLGYGLNGPIGGTASQYGIRSAGQDGVFQGGSYTAGTITERFDCDLVYSNGVFIQWPEGLQTH